MDLAEAKEIVRQADARTVALAQQQRPASRTSTGRWSSVRMRCSGLGGGGPDALFWAGPTTTPSEQYCADGELIFRRCATFEGEASLSGTSLGYEARLVGSSGEVEGGSSGGVLGERPGSSSGGGGNSPRGAGWLAGRTSSPGGVLSNVSLFNSVVSVSSPRRKSMAGPDSPGRFPGSPRGLAGLAGSAVLSRVVGGGVGGVLGGAFPRTAGSSRSSSPGPRGSPWEENSSKNAADSLHNLGTARATVALRPTRGIDGQVAVSAHRLLHRISSERVRQMHFLTAEQ